MNEYPQQLADAVDAVLADWLVRCVVQTARRAYGTCSPELTASAIAMSEAAHAVVMGQLVTLLEADVDQQRSNPLTVLRNAVEHPTRVLVAAEIPPVKRDDFAARAFPYDVYDLSPATWADIHESLLEPGVIWGAWKAKTVLDRRRLR